MGTVTPSARIGISSGRPARPGPVPLPAGTRLEYLDGMRATAALWVVCNHVWLTIYPAVGVRGDPGGLYGILTTWMVYGHFAVVGFIVLSGYSLSISTSSRGNRLKGTFLDFMRRRFHRIVVPYWGALVLSVILATTVIGKPTGTHWDRALPVTVKGVVLHVTLLQDLADPAQINHALWSIAIEWHIYFLFPLILLLRRRVGLIPATVLIVLVAEVISYRSGGGLTLPGETSLVGCFAVGVAAREIVQRQGRVPIRGTTSVPMPWTWLTIVFLVFIVGYCHHLGITTALHSNYRLEPLVALATGSLLVSLGTSRMRPIARFLSLRPMVFVGTFSYSLYLLHAPIIQLAWQYILEPLGISLHGGTGFAVLLPTSIAGATAIAWLYFMFVERRCLPASTKRSIDAELAAIRA